MQLTPVIAVHMTAAVLAVATGPVALWARRGREQRPRLHRAFGYAWVALMLVTAVSAVFIRDHKLPNMAGYTPIHLLVPVTLFSLFGAFWMLARGNFAGHRRIMQALYFIACIVAGAFTLLPQRLLGQAIWGTLGPILSHTPAWVWALLAVLLLLGATQMRDRTASLARVSLMPLGMAAFSLFGTVSAFGSAPMLPGALASWLAAAAAVTALLAGGPTAARYDRATGTYAVPGSVAPLLLILSVFLVRYVVNVQLAMNAQRLQDAAYVLSVATLYGVFTGAFLGRACRLWRLALRTPFAAVPA